MHDRSFTPMSGVKLALHFEVESLSLISYLAIAPADFNLVGFSKTEPAFWSRWATRLVFPSSGSGDCNRWCLEQLDGGGLHPMFLGPSYVLYDFSFAPLREINFLKPLKLNLFVGFEFTVESMIVKAVLRL